MKGSLATLLLARPVATRVTARASIRQYATQPTSAKVIRFANNGSPANVLRVESEQLRAVGANDVLVEMLAAPIHPADLNLVEGVYGSKATLPAVGGSEGVGNVLSVGAAVKNVAVGDRVVPAKAGLGTWRTHGVFSSEQLQRVPKALPVELAATITVNPMTALRLLEDFVPLHKGDVLVQNCANSAVGTAVVQLAKARGVTTVNIVRNRTGLDECVDRLKALGGDVVVTDDYARTPPFRRLLAEMPPIRLALNGVGGQSATELARMLSEGGTLVTYGGMSRQPVTVATSQLIFKDLRLRAFWLSRWAEHADAQTKAAAHLQLIEQLGSGNLHSFTELHPYHDFAAALARAQQPYRNHKILLQFNDFPQQQQQ